jgi:predicted enzyme related to lactoylglutathione lyase
MGAPVIQWEITSKNAGELQKFYSELFDWKVDTNNALGYGLVDTQN